MNKFLPVSAALAVVALSLPLSSQAGLYLGGAGLWAERDYYEDIDGSGGGKAILGYRLENIPLVFEANYLDAGEADITGTDLSLGFEGATFTIGYFLQLSRYGSGIWIRGGAYTGDATLKDSLGTLEKTSTSGPVFGIGGVWKLDRNIGLRLEFESLSDVDDFASNESMGVVSLGVVYEFLEPRQQRRPRYDRYERPPPPPPRSTPRVRPPYNDGYDGEGGARAPQSSSSAPVSDGEQIVARSELKSQPRASSPTLVTVPAGATVQPGQREANVEGRWVFVLYGRYSGWVREDAFGR